jgi:hypothetical protein
MGERERRFDLWPSTCLSGRTCCNESCDFLHRDQAAFAQKGILSSMKRKESEAIAAGSELWVVCCLSPLRSVHLIWCWGGGCVVAEACGIKGLCQSANAICLSAGQVCCNSSWYLYVCQVMSVLNKFVPVFTIPPNHSSPPSPSKR